MAFRRIALVATLLLSIAAPALAAGPLVNTEAGAVSGRASTGVVAYLGIPYAVPPVGDLRWRPPAAPASWSGTRHVTAFANSCAQPSRGIFAAPSNSEDCLYLNVFTPHGSDAAAKLPVMVWFYGGGLFSGESNDYDGSKLAQRGHVIVVTLNFHVGALGFLSVPSLNNEGHPHVDYGIMDQQAALRWVKQNIASFGGDAGNVTIFGQSGGGTAVMANLQSPTAKGLFHRAINESGTHITVVTPEAELKAGEASLHSDSLLHGSEANTSSRRRCGLTLRYTAGDVRAYLGWADKGVVVRGETPPHWANRPRPTDA